MKTILLCSDLDRTLLPNGAQIESPKVRNTFSKLAARKEIRLAYFSGRNEQLVKEAINKYELPEPHFVIGDVGTTLYRIDDNQWELDKNWQQEIGRDWHGNSRNDVVKLLSGLDGFALRLQEEEKQNSYKVSYYTDPLLDTTAIRKKVSALLDEHGILTSVIWSLDEKKNCGLLDILPQRASKLHAIRFLTEQEEIPETTTVFAGDSGNDLDALTSGLQAILVKNSTTDVQKAALEELEAKGRTDCLYIARGDLHGMNGNYAAGVIEGLVYFFPEIAGWLDLDISDHR
ncbi:MAG: HAD superfamily hydrolase (TIGR01484 family) [Desulforhopalus sp.]|jgi:HAD superfamily hydrolase (TIGR01484 family)